MTILDDRRPENSHIWAREELEHYVEPAWCSQRLFQVEPFRGGILDPCCGFGRIVKSAKAAGHDAIGSDLVQRAPNFPHGLDFLSNDYSLFRPANIVCNPPFDQCRAFAKRALMFANRKVAMIWPVRRLPAARWLRDTPLARIWLLTPRPSMPPGFVIARGEEPGGGKQDFCWLVWDKAGGYVGATDWLHRDHPQGATSDARHD